MKVPLILSISLLLFAGCVATKNDRLTITQQMIDKLAAKGQTLIESDKLVVESDLTIPFGANMLLSSPQLAFNSTITVPFGSSLTLTGSIAFSGCVIVEGTLAIEAATITCGLRKGSVPKEAVIRSTATTKEESDKAQPVLHLTNCAFTRIAALTIASGYFREVTICNMTVENSTFCNDAFNLKSAQLVVENLRCEGLSCRGSLLNWSGERSVLSGVFVTKCAFEIAEKSSDCISLFGKAKVHGCSFLSNQGAVTLLSVVSNESYIGHCTFRNNCVDQINMLGGHSTVSNCVFSDNVCAKYITHCAGGEASIVSCIYSNNMSEGSVLQCSLIMLNISSTVFISNNANILIESNKSERMCLSDVRIITNNAERVFSVACDKASPEYTLSNVGISGNSAKTLVAADAAFARAIFATSATWRENSGNLLLYSCDEPDSALSSQMAKVLADNQGVRKMYEKDPTRKQMDMVKMK